MGFPGDLPQVRRVSPCSIRMTRGQHPSRAGALVAAAALLSNTLD